MRAVILRNATNHPDLIAYIDGNNFGDQIVDVIYEDIQGNKRSVFFTVNQEGSHYQFDRKSVKSLVDMCEREIKKIAA